MPLYEYRCTKCGFDFEKIQKFNAEPEVVCPKCGGVLERPLTAPAFQFKGAGWYVNDYASKSAGSSSSTSSHSQSSSESAAGSESKPAESAPAASTPPATSSAT